MPGNRKMWDIGNTTVRNPERILGALRVFESSVAGRVNNRETQTAYWRALRGAGVLESEGRDGDWHGRKFLSALIQLGFVHRDKRRNLSLTPVGRRLLDYPELQSDIMLRQLLKYRVGSPIEPQNYLHLRPFVLILDVLRHARERGLGGLTRDEVAAFLIPTLRHEDGLAESIVDQVVKFRRELASVAGPVARRQYVGKVLESVVPESRRPRTLLDYADSSMRYARLTGAVTLSASGGRFVLSEARLDDILEILDDLPPDVSDREYIEHLHNPDTPFLHVDDVEVATERLQDLREVLAEAVFADVPEEVLSAPIPSSREALQVELFHLEQYAQLEEETRFYRGQRRIQALEEVRDILVEVQSGTSAYGVYRPAMLEWALWRLGLAINNIEGSIAETRGFNVDADFNPTGHAAPNRPDMNFRYPDGGALVVEGTLTTSGRQVAAEGEPVRRHVAVYKAKNPGRQVRTLFVAPSIDPNTYNEFYRGSYEIDDVEYETEIVPITISDVIYLIDKMRETGRILDNSGLMEVLDGLVALREKVESGRAWREALPGEFRRLVDQVIEEAPR